MNSIKNIREQLNNKAYDKQLGYIYACGEEGLPYYNARIEKLLARFEDYAPECESACIYSAPGRTEVGGNHTDHQHGCVLGAAVNMDALAVAAPSKSKLVRVNSEGYAPFELDLSSLEMIPEEHKSPAALVRGVAAALKNLGYEVDGFTACVTSDVPDGSGLSSSASFEVLIGTIFNDLYCGGKLSPMDIARAGQYAENVYACKPSGLLDQASASVGGLVEMDFAREDPVTGSLEFDFAKAGYTLCVVNTGGSHANLTGDYAAITQEMRAVAEYYGKELLCDVDSEKFFSEIITLRQKVGDRAVLRAMHYFDETARALKQADALREGDVEKFLVLVNESGRSSERLLQNGYSPANPAEQGVVLGVEMARRALRGKGAYRVHGGGFAGTIQAYVPNEDYARFEQELTAVFGAGSCHKLAIRPVGGVVIK